MAVYRKIPFLTFVIEPYRKVKINLSGCNFDCKGCFALAKQDIGISFSVENLLDLLIKSSHFIYGDMVSEVQITGGEPTIERNYLISLIKELKKLKVKQIGISTNGYLLDRSLVKELKLLDVSYIKLDIKAYTQRKHKYYTGKSNTRVLKAAKFLYKYGLNFYVRTIFIPQLVGTKEIEKIAQFLSNISQDIIYKIYQFAPEQLDVHIGRAPTLEEMWEALNVARRYLDHVDFYTTQTAYKPDPYKCVEVRVDQLLGRFNRIDEISKSVIKDWDMKYFSMSQILNSV